MNTTLFTRSSIASLARTLSKLNRPWLRWLLAAMLLLVLSWQSARLLWWIVTPMDAVPVVALPKVATTQTAYQWQHLFPTANSITTSTASDVFADASVLNGWQLLGVIVDDTSKLALVQQGNGGALLWLVEQQLTAQGVKVERIESKSIQLLTKQGSKTLNLSQALSTSLATPSPKPAQSAAVNLSELRAQAKQNPTSAMQWLNLQPQFDNGRLVSVLVQPKAGQEAIFKQLGFMVGDQLVALNGQPMSEWMTKLASLPSLLDGAGASVKVLRAGKEQEWSVTW
jgi:type II secretion system protein C